jgi:protein gp37
MSKSNIEWTEETWNPIVGCSIVSPGCARCYAMKMAHRIEAMNLEAKSTGNGHAPQYNGTTKVVNGNAVWTGKLARASEKILTAPLRRKKPTTYFVNSMGDLFHEDCPDEWIDQVFAVMALSPHHTFQVLTKRAERMSAYMNRPLAHGLASGAVGLFDALNEAAHALTDPPRTVFPTLKHGMVPHPGWPLPNVWLGVSTERQQEADERIPHLLNTPAAVRFISAEPLLAPIDLTRVPRTDKPGRDAILAGRYREGENWRDYPRLDWVIAGGESGADSRPMSSQWPRRLRDQCKAAGVAFFFKQWGEWKPAGFHPSETPGRFAFGDYEHDPAQMIQVDRYPRQFTKFGARSVMQRVGKKNAGRLLDGVEHNETPNTAAHFIATAKRAVPA